MRKLILFIICVLVGIYGYADMARFSTAGFYELPNTGREVYSLNQAWRFWKGELEGMPYAVNYDDTDWEVVSVPHGLEYLPVEASAIASVSVSAAKGIEVYLEDRELRLSIATDDWAGNIARLGVTLSDLARRQELRYVREVRASDNSVWVILNRAAG